MKKILIANRGEIACRVIKSCRRLGLTTVAIYSSQDVQALHVKQADEAYLINKPAALAYLSISDIINIAKSCQAEAIHPGYGFLSENAQFAQACLDSQLIFIGPSPQCIDILGEKKNAKLYISQNNLPIQLIPGYHGEDQSLETLSKEALKLGFPVLLKASAGGGGRGMRIVRDTASLREQIVTAKSEALRLFGSDHLLVEKYIESCKHVEVQILGDKYGQVIHCFERECSVQRRNQKVIEEAPCSLLDEQLRNDITKAAVALAKALKYEGAGTMEFVLDLKEKKYYFLEVNTRIQVEHPITELITGLDLVELQIKIAAGESLQQLVPPISIKGHAIECRIYAENPAKDFSPSSGKLLLCQFPLELAYFRCETSYQTGDDVSIFYDPLLAKLCVWGNNRKEAIERMIGVLQQTVIMGVTHNTTYLMSVLQSELFERGHNYDTQMLRHFTTLTSETPALIAPLIISTLLCQIHRRRQRLNNWKGISSGWRLLKYRPQRDVYHFFDGFGQSFNDEGLSLEYSNVWEGNNKVELTFSLTTSEMVLKEGKASLLNISDYSPDSIVKLLECEIDGQRFRILHAPSNVRTEGHRVEESYHAVVVQPVWKFKQGGVDYQSRLYQTAADNSGELSRKEKTLTNMPCRILKVFFQDGDDVQAKQVVMVVESMKMELRFNAPATGKLRLLVNEGQMVEAGSTLFEVVS